MNRTKIIAYLEGGLTASERVAFEEKQATDKAFAQKVADIKADWEIEVMVGRDYLKSQMKDWKKELIDGEKAKEEIKVIPLWRKNSFRIGIAASILFLISLGIHQWGNASLSNQAIFSAYYKADLPQSKGSANDQLAAIIQLNLEGKYDIALQQASQLLNTTEDEELQIKINHEIAQIYLAKQDYQNAIKYSNFVVNTVNENSPIWQQTQFNLIVLHLLNGETNLARNKLASLKSRNNLSPAELYKLEALEDKIKNPLRNWF